MSDAFAPMRLIADASTSLCISASLLSKVFCENAPWSFDNAEESKVLFITYGIIAEEVLRAKLILKNSSVSSSVMKFVTLKPLDIKKVEADIEKISPDLIVVVEEGMKSGGFGEHITTRIKNSARCDRRLR